MKKVLVFGGTGNVGRKVLQELKQHDYEVTVVLRSPEKLHLVSQWIDHYFVADIREERELSYVCKGQEIVISTLGKSVSVNDKDKATFMDVDYGGNKNIVKASLQNNISKFVYLSAIHSEHYQHLQYFKAHHDFSELLKNSGIDYSIIKVPAIFSAFLDVLDLAKKGKLVTLGEGQCTTNPIYEGDVAEVIVKAITSPFFIMEAGGSKLYTRKQINDIIQQCVNPKKKCPNIPVFLVKMLLPCIKFVDKNMYDKFAFFLEVTQHDVIAPMIGTALFEDYIKDKV